MSNDLWRWAAPDGQQRRVRLDELRAALAEGAIAPNTPVWRSGWKAWQPAHEVPELASGAVAAANGVVPNIPPPPLAMVAVQHEFEAKSGGSFAPPAPEEEPPPPPAFVPAPTKATSIAPAAPGSGPQLPSNLPTAIGLPPPPEMAAMVASAKANAANKADPMIEELSGSMLLDAESSPGPVKSPFDVGAGGGPPPTDPVIRDQRDSLDDAALPPMRRPGLTLLLEDLQEIRAGRQPRNKLLIGVLAILVLSVFISLLALVVSAIRGKPSEIATSPSSTPSGSAGTSDPPSTTAAAAATTSAPPAVTSAPPKEEPPPPDTSAALGDCKLAGDAHVVGPRAFLPGGVEAAPVPGAIALGFAINPRDGVAVSVDPATINITSTVRGRALGGDARRVSPVMMQGKLAVVADVDRKMDKLLGRRVVATSPPLDVGVAENAIVWAPHGSGSWAKLFNLEGEGPVEALRAVPLAQGKGIALAFRRSGAVFVGTAKGDSVLSPDGSLARIAGLGPQVGSPAITSSGESVIVAWADRGGAPDPWQVRWTKLAPGGAPAPPKELALPDGGLGTQAMSPSLAGLGGGRWLVAWTEGPVSNHQVRALTMSAEGAPSGEALSISPAGINAGQPQAAIGADGKGVVAFLAAKGRISEVHATPVSCSGK
ncbi:MAG: DUF4339 domain-containing protein [Labilithrix sp.]|nr:DUF4339 domain-containing protein [Labilithrix sp.]